MFLNRLLTKKSIVSFLAIDVYLARTGKQSEKRSDFGTQIMPHSPPVMLSSLTD